MFIKFIIVHFRFAENGTSCEKIATIDLGELHADLATGTHYNSFYYPLFSLNFDE